MSDETNLDDLEKLRVLTTFYRHLDGRNTTSLTALLHPDIKWLRAGKELSSIPEIASVLDQRSTSMEAFHILTSVVFDSASAGDATYSGYLGVMKSEDRDGPAAGVATAHVLHVCRGALRKTEDGWRIIRLDAGPPRISIPI